MTPVGYFKEAAEIEFVTSLAVRKYFVSFWAMITWTPACYSNSAMFRILFIVTS